MVDRTGEPVEERIAEERESSGAQIRALLNEQRKTIIAEYCEKVAHHEFLAAQAEQDRRILQEELLRQQQDFHEVHQQDLIKMKELQKFQNSTFDEFTRQKFIEDQKIIMELSGRLQDLQNEVNCMNDSKDFQDVESVRSGNSHITSQPGVFPKHPPFEGLLRPSFISQRQTEEPPNTWDTSGISGNVFAHPQASSSAPYPQGLNSTWKKTIEEPIHMSTVEKSERPERDQDLRCQSGPSAKDSVIFSGGDYSKNYGADQQRLQISDLHFDKFPTPATFACWKIRFKAEVCTCSQFPTEAMQWIKEVELVDSVDELRSTSSTRGISMPNFEVLDARIAESSPSNPSPNSFMRQSERKPSRTRSPRGKSPSGRMSRWPCKDYLGGTCNNSFCEKWHLPECLYYKTKNGCRFGEKCSFAHRQVDAQPTKWSKSNNDESAVSILKKENWQERESVSDSCHDRTGKLVRKSGKKLGRNSSKRQLSDARQLGCVFQDMTPPKSILRKSTDMPKPIQRVKFKKAIARHTKIRDQNPSLGYICPGEPHERSPNAPKFEDRSQEETEWQEQGAREAAWKLAKNVFKLKEHERAAFFSSPENRCLPASTLKPEEREFVVDSGASMHMISKKDLSNAEMDTLTKSCSPTIVITANGEVQTHEEAIVYDRKLDIFLTMKVLENTPAVLSLGKLCDENGYSYEWINGQKPHLIKNGIRIICNTENFVPIVVPGLTSSSSTSSSSSPSSPTVGDMSVREREDESNRDISPVPVSESVGDRTGELVETQANKIPKTNQKETTIERSNLCDDPEIPEWLQEFRENLVDDEIPLKGGSHASSSHEASLEPTTKRRQDLGKHKMFILISLKTEIARSASGPKLQGLRTEDARAKPYLELSILVT